MHVLGTKRIRTTAYHPIANELIERFHRQLKAALKCQQTPTNWVTLILLGIRTALKEDLKCSVAELVYGTTLRLPGEFFDSPHNTTTDPAGYVNKLRDSMQLLRATPTRLPRHRRVFVDQACTHVFVRHDAVRTPLQKRLEKSHVLRIKGQNRTTSMGRLKPTHLDPVFPCEKQLSPSATTMSPHPVPPSRTPLQPNSPSLPHTTRSGRRIRWPQHLHEYVP